MAFAADIELRRVGERQARSDGHAMPALLACDLQVRQAHLREGLAGELTLSTLDLLHAQDIRGLLGHKAGGLFGAKANRIDIPGADTKAHAFPYEGSRSLGMGRNKETPGHGEARAFQWSLMPPPGGDWVRHGFRRRVRAPMA